MKRKMFALCFAIVSCILQSHAEAPKVFVNPSVTSVDLTLHLVTNARRDPAPYMPGYGTNVRLRTFSDVDGFYDFTPRSGSTGVPVFGYSPYAMCDSKVMKVVGYYYNCDYGPCRMYVYLSVLVGSTTYYMYWPAYRENSSTNYTNFLQPA